jgi:RNA polymerase sigma factor (sigma-70 family)
LAQLRFASQKQCLKQLEAAEKLLAIIDRNREYPFDFVCFRITGFQPKDPPEQQTIKGDRLADDLHIFISSLSDRFAQPVTEQSEKVYTIEELAVAFAVSTKTVYRWQKKGLPGRKYIFAGGKKSFGFLQSSVDKFIQSNPDFIARAKTFTRLTKDQKQQIIKQTATLAADTRMPRCRVIDQIAAKIGRARETIRYTILQYEKAHPDKPLFKRPAGVINSTQAAELYRLFKQGTGVRELMKQFNRSRSSIYRLVNKRRAKALLAKKIEFVPSDEFLQKNAKKKILSKPVAVEKTASAGRFEPFQLLDGHLLPEYLQTLKDTPVLNRERERELFRRYNYLKYLACTTRAGIKPTQVSSERIQEIEDYFTEAETIRKMIVEANLRLVVSIASKHVSTGASFLDLVSKGNFALMKAVEEFDYTTGFRFSKRASLNIAKEYAKVSGRSTQLSRKRAARLSDIQRDLRDAAAADLGAVERAHRSLAQVIKNELNEREQYVILNHFGLTGPPIRKKTKTLKQIGQELSVSKERARQIELRALQKLRQSLSSEEFELLTR